VGNVCVWQEEKKKRGRTDFRVSPHRVWGKREPGRGRSRCGESGFWVQIPPFLPPSYEHFELSPDGVRAYHEKRANRPMENQGLMPNRRRGRREMPRNRVWGLSAPRLGQTRCGDGGNSVAGGGGKGAKRGEWRGGGVESGDKALGKRGLCKVDGGGGSGIIVVFQSPGKVWTGRRRGGEGARVGAKPEASPAVKGLLVEHEGHFGGYGRQENAPVVRSKVGQDALRRRLGFGRNWKMKSFIAVAVVALGVFVAQASSTITWYASWTGEGWQNLK